MKSRLRSHARLLGAQVGEVARWMVLATLVGAVVAVAIFGFITAVHAGYTALREADGWLHYAVPVAAAALMGLTVYRFQPVSRGAGTPDYVHALNNRQGYIPLSLVVAKYLASVVSLAGGLSGGMVGPGTVIGGGIGAWFGRRLKGLFPGTRRSGRDLRLAATCGCGAAVAAVLHTPIGAAVFAVEVLFPASIHYEFYFPAALASAVGYLVFGWLAGWPRLVEAPPLALSRALLVPVLASTLLVTLVGLGFIWLYRTVHRLSYRWRRQTWLGPTAGAVLFAGVAALAGEGVFCTGEWHIQEMLDAAAPAVSVAAVLMVGKAVATALVVGSGTSGGLVGPVLVVGAAAGALVAGLMGIADPSVRAAACAAGIAGMLAAVLNVPVAAALIVTEAFGVAYVVPALAGSVLAYKLAKPVFVYEYVLPGPGTRGPRGLLPAKE